MSPGQHTSATTLVIILKPWEHDQHPNLRGESMPNAALNQKLQPSPKMAEVIGSSEPVTRAEAVKRLWDYFKKHNLQNPENRREILADDKLKPLFGKAKITMFEVGRIVNENLGGGASKSKTKGKKENAA